MRKTEAQGISFDPALLAKAKRAAAADGRSLSGYIRYLVSRDLEAQRKPKRRTSRRKPAA